MPEAALLIPLAFLGLPESVSGILGTVLGFGILVFVHELGHFMVAKWAGVKVEVFSLGFGPRLLGFERGGTDYRISALPLGGYVRMLGQDDSDPNTPKTGAPDDFRNKSVAKRMAILIAGVVMNTIFATLAFIAAFAVGVEFVAPEVGTVHPNQGGNRARIVGQTTPPKGILAGDQILRINGAQILAWEDIQTTVALSGSKLLIDIARPNSATGAVENLTLEATPTREPEDPFPRLGLDPTYVVAEFADDSPAPAAGIKKDDQIVEVGPLGDSAGSPTDAFNVGHDPVVLDNPDKPIRVVVQRRVYDADGRPAEQPPQRVTLEVKPRGRSIWGIGLKFKDRAHVTNLQTGSPSRGVLEIGDTIVAIDGREVRASNLREVVRAAGDAHAVAGEKKTAPISIQFERRIAGKWEPREAKVQLDRRESDDGWFLGVGWTSDEVESVEPGSPAAGVGIEPGDFVTTVWPDRFLGIYRGAAHSTTTSAADLIKRAANTKKGERWRIGWQKHDGSEKRAEIVAIDTKVLEGDIGIFATPRPIVIRRGVAGSCSLGVNRTVHMFEQLIVTIRSLFGGSVSTGELGGPIQIASITYKIAQVGTGKLIYFLAILSVNLAVLNILPIPVLDGGQIFLLAIEKLKGRPLSDDVMRYVQYGGLIFVIGLMLYVTFNDIRRWFE
jgi:regulator of sigma E protease